MKCKVCGGEIQEGAQFCTNCGTKVEEVVSNNESINQVNNEQVVVPEVNVESQSLGQNNLNMNEPISFNQAVDNVSNNNINELSNNGVSEIANENLNVISTNNVNELQGNNINQIPNNNINVIPNNNVSEVSNNNYGGSNLDNNYEEKANIGLAILSFIIPLVGLIIFLTKKNKQPKTAKTCGICALISFILGIILSFIMMIFVPVFIAGSIINETNQQVNEINNNYYNEEDYHANNYNNVVNNVVTNEENDNEINSDLISNDWQKYEVMVNNKIIKLPSTYNDITNTTGFTYKSSDLNSNLEKNHYTKVNMYKNDKLALYIDILNDSEEDLLYTNCKITRISQTKYQVEQGADVVLFPGELKAGIEITEDKIIELFGNPTDKRDNSSDGYQTITYKYNADTTWTTTKFYEIRVVNGVIDQLTLDNR